MTLNSHLQNSVFIGPVSVKTVTRVLPVERKPKPKVAAILVVGGAWVKFPTTEMKRNMFADKEERVEHSVQFADLRSVSVRSRHEHQIAAEGDPARVHPLIILSNPRKHR